MVKRYETPSAIILMLVKEREGRKTVLLQKRRNTGFADGMWDLSCSGHVEEGESMISAVVREAREELGISIQPSDVKFFTLIHKRDNECGLTYYNGYFCCTHYDGEPTICEKDKCSQLEWFGFDRLPEEIIADRKKALEAYFSGVPYLEYGW